MIYSNNFEYLKTADLSNDKQIEMYSWESNDNIDSGVDRYGTIFKVNTDSEDVEIEHPTEQVYGEFVVEKRR